MNEQQKLKYSEMIKAEAKRLGFLFCGISKAEFLEEEASRLEKWLRNDYQGEMAYMNNHFDKRLDPRLLVDGAKSVISIALNYYTDAKQNDESAPKISKYAYGTDYHFVIKDKLKSLHHFIEENIGAVSGRAFVDSAPVLDKAWAKKGGLGWVGKNANIINNKSGSFFFLGELIVDMELAYDVPFSTDHCGTCTRCIDACPTEAIVSPYVVDGSKCISYLTIELKEEIPHSFKNKMDNWMFGCDVCQNVCPWNRFSVIHQEEAFNPHPDLLEMSKRDWEEITEEVFGKVFKKSAVKRTKIAGLKRNITFIKTVE
ncbi:iron-sulfur cluster binding protein [Pseudopedobacter saltans DSM 12145]|uniref:Epoxyqueuosine reductase n=1 Tax=Pseudopedobacter saltans (strain ATCC 51119 / DSM 12145 / JCM 21818 / CCUG 39354 / LMG 10337 / NBRC 100064 / NCIMB 13643) TaxID=762903 RepID=F0S927_PSESL|nr:tRNA epoxyqueuosine(34) reductase QueG [Pseudopedobacter saltans]ADY51325.1 iron-sulfur cluster binding protein [Pseudopedobacter saltans DSM 12145]